MDLDDLIRDDFEMRKIPLIKLIRAMLPGTNLRAAKLTAEAVLAYQSQTFDFAGERRELREALDGRDYPWLVQNLLNAERQRLRDKETEAFNRLLDRLTTDKALAELRAKLAGFPDPE